MLRRTSVPFLVFLIDAGKKFGVVIDKHLSFYDHGLVSFWKTLRNRDEWNTPTVDFPSLMCTVNANVFSKLFYCFSVWAGTSKGTFPGFNKFKAFKPEFYLAKRNLGI